MNYPLRNYLSAPLTFDFHAKVWLCSPWTDAKFLTTMPYAYFLNLQWLFLSFAVHYWVIARVSSYENYQSAQSSFLNYATTLLSLWFNLSISSY